MNSVQTNASQLNRFEISHIAHGANVEMENLEDAIKIARDTLGKDTYERMKEQAVIACECYTKIQSKTEMPKSIFGDSFGYDMQKDIANYMQDYYAGKMSADDLKQYFNDCCSDMLDYRVQKHDISGNMDDFKVNIISKVYELFAKENARAASHANYAEGEKINAGYADGNRQNWVYYNADYYYQCEEVRKMLGEIVNGVAEQWNIGEIDTKEIEKNSDLTLDGGFDFNSIWNFTYRNQVSIASMTDENAVPPRDFKMFYKERAHIGDANDIGKIDLWIGNQKYSKKVPFFITRDSLKGQIFNVNDLMKDYYKNNENVKDYVSFLNQIFVFTKWYSHESGINNIFGNYNPESI